MFDPAELCRGGILEQRTTECGGFLPDTHLLFDLAELCEGVVVAGRNARAVRPQPNPQIRRFRLDVEATAEAKWEELSLIHI